MSTWIVYLVLMLDNVSEVLIGTFLTSVTVFVIMTLAFFTVEKCDEDWRPLFVRWWIRSGVVLVITGLFAAFTPTTKQACIIYVLPKIANNEQVQQVPQKLLDIANRQLDEWVKEYTPKKDGE